MPPSPPKQVFVDCVSVDGPLDKKEMTETLRFDFENLNFDSHGICMSAFPSEGHGHDWSLMIRRTRDTPKIDEDAFTCDLMISGAINVPETFFILLRYKGLSSNVAQYTFQEHDSIISYSNFLPREIAQRDFRQNNHSLIIECDIQLAEHWCPMSLQPRTVLADLYEDGKSETADVEFCVGTATYRAHKCILYLRCEKLYEIAKDAATVTLKANKRAFKTMLDFVYAVQLPDISTENFAIELLATSHAFGCIPLKHYVESIIVDRILNAENAAEYLILADMDECALLEEAAIELFRSNPFETDPDWANAELSTRLRTSFRMKEVMKCDNSFGGNINIADLNPVRDVTFLRGKLQKAGLPIDGHVEVLMDRFANLQLQTLKKKQTESDVEKSMDSENGISGIKPFAF